MSDWVDPRTVQWVIRIFSGAYLVVISWSVYRYYYGSNTRSDTSNGSTSDVGGDFLDQDESPTVHVQNVNANLRIDQFQDHNMSDEDDSNDSELDAIDPVDIEDIEPTNADHTSLDTNVVHSNKTTVKSEHSTIDYSKFNKEQLDDRLRRDLSKQGYKLVESHSAVKMCRWTKNSMRGRGGCYKHTFYGIKSYQCMEMTPNLACASKCTFCWRHHKNPTGTEWKWKMDPPDKILEQCLKNHEDMIRQFKGVPGVSEQRLLEAQSVRHCALSLVGEPIFYPRINELLEMLHARRISTFLVTNAQFPDAMRHLVPVTQLYVSIDAANKETLKKIDRPLYKDYWERYLDCLKILSLTKQRTVFRMTLVQKGNMEDLDGYAKLIALGKPDFIEIKGVTYCGTSKSSKLTMDNVPWHEDVVRFAQDLLIHLDANTYELACEHSHSNCVLIANKRFKINGEWHTWIDYGKFFELIQQSTNSEIYKNDIDSLAYAAKTPAWAVFGSDEAGFDPEHIRWIRKDHKLKLLNERIAAQQKDADLYMANKSCCKSTNAIESDQSCACKSNTAS